MANRPAASGSRSSRAVSAPRTIRATWRSAASSMPNSVEERIEAAQLAPMRELDAVDVEGHRVQLAGGLAHPVGGDVEDPRVRIDEPAQEPGAADAIDLRPLARHPAARAPVGRSRHDVLEDGRPARLDERGEAAREVACPPPRRPQQGDGGLADRVAMGAVDDEVQVGRQGRPPRRGVSMIAPGGARDDARAGVERLAAAHVDHTRCGRRADLTGQLRCRYTMVGLGHLDLPPVLDRARHRLVGSAMQTGIVHDGMSRFDGMNSIPPSTSALRAFAAAAQTGSFTRAAQDLGQTQGAVSHQIAQLEARLRVRLFRREPRGLSLTQAGQAYLPFVREALERLRAGEQALVATASDRVLTVTVSPNFASRWLVPRLGDFLDRHPDLDLRISASLQHVDLTADGIDLAIRHGDGDWPQLHVTRLSEELLFPVCSPAWLATAPTLRVAADLRRQVLIHDRDRDGWRRWLAAQGVAGVDLERGPVFNQTSLAIDAAVAGQGVALARSALAVLDLAAGRLVRPVPEASPAPFAYWILCPKPNAELSKLVRFRAWLLDQAERDRRSLAAMAN